MMKRDSNCVCGLRIVCFYLAIIGTLIFISGTRAHDVYNIDEFSINQSNEKTTSKVEELQGSISRYYEHTVVSNEWPPAGLQSQLNELRHLKEDSDLSLDFFLNKGINIYSVNELNKNPLAARTVEGNNALTAAIALIELAAELKDQDKFVEELASDGKAGYLFKILLEYNADAHR